MGNLEARRRQAERTENVALVHNAPEPREGNILTLVMVVMTVKNTLGLGRGESEGK